MVSICRRLDGLPLAIELAAARLRSLSLCGLADRLDQRFRLLTRGSRTALARQQTLEATVEWSYSLLTAPSSCCCGACRCSPRASTWTPPKRSAASGASRLFEVTGLLGSLVDKSLVVAEPAGQPCATGCWRPSASSPPNSSPEAGDDQAAAAKAAHCAHYLSVAETAAPHLTGPDQGSWLARLDAEQANLRRAAEHAASRPDGTAQVLRLGVALRRYWRARDPGTGSPRAAPAGTGPARSPGGPASCSAQRWSPPPSPPATLT